MRYWLMKSEPSVFTVEELEKAPNKTVTGFPQKVSGIIRLEIL